MAATQPSLQEWTVGALVAQWATEQLQDNAVSIQLGDRALSFVGRACFLCPTF
ncbi:MAG: hypothetical protein Q8N35_15410 [Methylococcaceae bacterium]|nr:hypothetical protein [Methylococcaceae bacterium]MDZ4154997.1 hypothetical protein [Methylococcales bacterium]MDP2393385.1 hypothetical protein [Methylococcaceae bacterium]MDP3020967.1 hypothetical protein [Methylococcaceae bacterium]MDP3392031.1 hypothetical protein [Methylococcaceae bacterium]